MNEKDIATKQYMQINEIFADLCNYKLFHGESVIQPDDLQEADITELALFSKKQHHNQKEKYSIQKLRDVLKHCVAKTTGNVIYLLIGIENESKVHYAMPVRNMLYDALDYSEQITALTREHRLEKDLTKEEFLSGISKEDRLIPVITIVIYWNTGTWDGPRSLHEMLATQDEAVLKYVPDYKLNLIVPEELTDFERFQTELRSVMEFFSCAGSGKQLSNFIQRNQKNGISMSPEALNVINTCLQTELRLPEREEEPNVCKGIEEIKQWSREEGESFGKINTLLSLVRDGLLDVSIAAERADMPKEEFMKLLEV